MENNSHTQKTSMGQEQSTPPSWFKRHPFLFSGIVLCIIGLAYLVYLTRGMPSLTELENIDPALVTIYVPLDRIPDHTQKALLATEDRDFFEHWGIDLKRVPKAIFIDLVTLSFRQGFSTITMQLARNLYTKKIGFQKNINRKLREILTALQIERTYSKREILEMYLNMAYFGHGVYGIQSAARKYFGKDVSELTPEESATLIALLKSPAYYSPFRHPERSMKRRNLVLYNMLTQGYLTQAEYDSLKQLPVQVATDQASGEIAPYFAEYVRQKLNQLQDSLGVNVYEDGLNVFTTRH